MALKKYNLDEFMFEFSPSLYGRDEFVDRAFEMSTELMEKYKDVPAKEMVNKWGELDRKSVV